MPARCSVLAIGLSHPNEHVQRGMGPERQRPPSSPDHSSGLCPDLGRLLDGMERGDAAVLDHTRLCPHCADEWALYRGFMRAPEASQQGLLMKMLRKVRSLWSRLNNSL